MVFNAGVEDCIYNFFNSIELDIAAKKNIKTDKIKTNSKKMNISKQAPGSLMQPTVVKETGLFSSNKNSKKAQSQNFKDKIKFFNSNSDSIKNYRRVEPQVSVLNLLK